MEHLHNNDLLYTNYTVPGYTPGLHHRATQYTLATHQGYTVYPGYTPGLHSIPWLHTRATQYTCLHTRATPQGYTVPGYTGLS